MTVDYTPSTIPFDILQTVKLCDYHWMWKWMHQNSRH